MKLPVFPLIVMTLMTHACGSSSDKPQEKESQHFRNVIFIIGDDHSAEVLGAYGNSIVRTPNLDQMARRGIMFTHAYVNSPVCSPSRQSMITGKYPHATGVSLLTSSFPEEQITIADHLSPLGFKTALIGKHHFNNTLNHGFSLKIEKKDYLKHVSENSPGVLSASIKSRPQWKPFKDPAHIWLNAEGLPSAYHDEDDAGTFYAKKAIDFINQNQEERFCLWLGFEEPHSPFNFPVEFANRYNPDEMPLPQGSPEDDRWVPAVFKDLTDEQKKGIIASYYTSVEYLDKNVGLVLDAVNKAGLAESTLVIYVGDHGYLLNDHKRFEKHMMWEPAVRAPLIIQGGKKYGQNRVEPAMTEFVDLVPTVVEALGVDALAGVHGKSLVPLLTRETDKHKDYVFSEFLEDNKAMIRTKEWKYIFTTGKNDLGQGYATGNPPPGLTHRLYDMTGDPKEAHNLSDDPRYQEIMSQLQQKMLHVFETTHPKGGKLPDTWSTEEKLVAYCEPPERNVTK
jgi:choline-sulfatase